MSQREFSPAEIRGIQTMRERGNRLVDIAYVYRCSVSTITDILDGKPKKEKAEKEKKPAPPTIREILAERREPDEPPPLPPDWCHIFCCNDRKACTEIEHPQQCLVWRLYNDEKKKNLQKYALVDRRRKKCHVTH